MKKKFTNSELFVGTDKLVSAVGNMLDMIIGCEKSPVRDRMLTAVGGLQKYLDSLRGYKFTLSIARSKGVSEPSWTAEGTVGPVETIMFRVNEEPCLHLIFFRNNDTGEVSDTNIIATFPIPPSPPEAS